MTPRAKKSNGNEPATKNFVRQSIDELAEAVKVGFDNTATKEDISVIKKDVSGLKKGQASLQAGQASLKESQERILSIVESIDDHSKEHRDIPRRVERLEVDVFKLQTRPR